MKAEDNIDSFNEVANLIHKAFVRNRNKKLIFGFFFFCLSLYYFIFFPIQALPAQTALGITIFVLLVGFLGFYLLLSGVLKYDIQKNHFLQILKKQPEKIVWIYYQKMEQMPFGIKIFELTTLYISLSNRQQITISLPENQILNLMDALKKHLSKASFGYSQEKEQLFEIAPDLLRK